ncbi:hypothetical protein Dimus_006027 [Dionaea muscipula]
MLLTLHPKLVDAPYAAVEAGRCYCFLREAAQFWKVIGTGEHRWPFFLSSGSVIVGCGYSGVELAATISDRLQNKGIVQAVNVETTICLSAPPGNREAALKVLAERNVQLFVGYFVHAVRKAF